MKHPTLDQFVQKVMSIDTDYTGLGGASSGIIGGSSTNQDIANDLRINVLSFAAEYSRPTLDKNILEQYAQQLQGSFLAIKMLNIISDDKLEELFSELEGFLHSRTE